MELNSGREMPINGLGTWQSGPGEVANAVKHALKTGYRHIDCAALYENENEVGQGIKEAMEEYDIAREDIFVTGKLWNTKHKIDEVEVACQKSLEDLGLEYLDLYLIHWPTAFATSDELIPKDEDGNIEFDVENDPVDTWLAMEQLVEKGLVKDIGVSNFNSKQVQTILEKGSIKPVTNQIECHPYLKQEKMIEFCKEQDIIVTAYAPLGSPSRPWADASAPIILEEAIILEIAKEYEKTPAQIILRWNLERGVAIVPKSTNHERIEENLNVFDFNLNESDMEQINSLNKGVSGRLFPMKDFSAHPYYPFKEELTTLKLNTGREIPVIGLGTWQSAAGEVEGAVKHSLSIGYRHVDCAPLYQNEGEVGEGIKQAIEELGIPREEIFVCSKLWNTKHHPDDVEAACRKSLEDLGLEYIDLYLMHWPTAFERGDDFFPKDEEGNMKYDLDLHPTETWKEMEKLVENGLVKDIGVSNFSTAQIQDIIENGTIKPVINQVECHPYLQQDKLIEYCKDNDIVVTAYSPLGTPTRPWASTDEPRLLDDPRIENLANKYSKTPAQIILRWQTQRGVVVVPKSANENRMAENYNVLDFCLEDGDMEILKSFDRGTLGRLLAIKSQGGLFWDTAHPHFPFKEDILNLPLNTGRSIPIVGLGTWQSAAGEVETAVKHALSIGYRHIDCAPLYQNEGEVGEGIKQAIEELKIPREEIFVCSKLWNTKHHPDEVEAACRKSLEDLGLDYIDLYLMHWPTAYERGDDFFPKDEEGNMKYDVDLHPTDTWMEMEKLVELGLVKDIGVSNFNSVQIQDIVEKGTIKPVVNQVECHPYMQQSKLIDFCKEHDILITAYSPLGTPTRPWAGPDEPKLLEDSKIIEIANSYNKTPAQIILRWQIERGVIVVPKSVNETRIEENFNVLDFTLNEADMEELKSFDKGRFGRLLAVKTKGGLFWDTDHPHFPFASSY